MQINICEPFVIKHKHLLSWSKAYITTTTTTQEAAQSLCLQGTQGYVVDGNLIGQSVTCAVYV